MPIPKELRHYYHTPEFLAAREEALTSAGYRCEECRKPHMAVVETITALSGEDGRPAMFWRAVSGVWTNHHGQPGKPPRGLRPHPVLVKIGVAHLDHDPANIGIDNLRALCQWCHFIYDLGRHKETRSIHKDAKRPIRWEGAIAV